MESKEAARAAVTARLAQQRMANSDLVRLTGLDAGTVADFLAGTRWPRRPTLARIDEAIGWEPGTTEAIAAGTLAPDVSGNRDDQGVMIDVDPAVYEDLTPAELAEAVATAKAVFLKTARDIRNTRLIDHH